MAQNNAPKIDTLENIEESLSNAELFIEKNQKKLILKAQTYKQMY